MRLLISTLSDLIKSKTVIALILASVAAGVLIAFVVWGYGLKTIPSGLQGQPEQLRLNTLPKQASHLPLVAYALAML